LSRQWRKCLIDYVELEKKLLKLTSISDHHWETFTPYIMELSINVTSFLVEWKPEKLLGLLASTDQLRHLELDEFPLVPGWLSGVGEVCTNLESFSFRPE